MLIKDIKKSKYFKAMDETILCELMHPKNESEEFEMNFSIAHAVLEPGKFSLPHKIIGSVEIYYILEGEGCIHIDNEERIVKTGQAIYIPKNSCQMLKNTGNENLKFLCIVSPPWREDREKFCSKNNTL